MKTKNVVKRQNLDLKPKRPVKWKPASRLGDITGPEGYRLRWCDSNPDNIAKKEAEGWVILDKSKFPDLKGSNYERQTTDSEGLTKTVLKRNELIAMVLPEEAALERTEYYRQETEDRTKAAFTNSEVKKLLSKGNSRLGRNTHSISDGVSVID